jgi:hypothetical protein
MHRCVMHSKQYASEMEFAQAIHGFFKVTLPGHWKSIRDTVSDNFLSAGPTIFGSSGDSGMSIFFYYART